MSSKTDWPFTFSWNSFQEKMATVLLAPRAYDLGNSAIEKKTIGSAIHIDQNSSKNARTHQTDAGNEFYASKNGTPISFRDQYDL